MSSPVRLEHDRGLAVVTFDSPPLNLFDDALSAALSEIGVPTATELAEGVVAIVGVAFVTVTLSSEQAEETELLLVSPL